MTSRADAIKEGYKYYCINCNTVYKHLPTEDYEDGHGGRLLTMCRCGCDIIADLKTDETVEA